MKILVISGFLGAGKTTFIKEMIKGTKREYVVFENEFSDINIDGDILKNSDLIEDKELEVYELTNGCICCNMKGDFTASVIVISNSLDPDFLIIEPSGVAVLSSILENLRKIEYDRISLLDPISIVDVNTYFKYKVKYNDIFIDQIKSTSFIQLSKTEQADTELIEKIVDDIKEINRDAKIFIDHYKNAGIEYWNDLFKGELNKSFDINNSVELGLENISFKNAYVSTFGELIYFINQILMGVYGDICRAKGVFSTNQGKLRFDIVDGIYYITNAEDDDENNIVLIGKDLNKLLLKMKLSNLKINDNKKFKTRFKI